MKLPKAISRLIDSFERLPGIGPKTAQRLVFYLLHVPQDHLDEFSRSLENLKKETVICSLCFNVSESDPCSICTDRNRDQGIICVVEQPLDILAIEKGNSYQGLYHVLHGVIDPLNNIGPDELRINELFQRLKNNHGVDELILATDPTMEGEATAMYIKSKVKSQKLKVKISRIGLGLPTGADLEYADEVTLKRAMEGRKKY